LANYRHKVEALSLLNGAPEKFQKIDHCHGSASGSPLSKKTGLEKVFRKFPKEAVMRLHHHVAQRSHLPARSIAGVSPILAVMAAIALGLMVSYPKPAFPQPVQLVKVDVAVVAKGYRTSKLIGSNVQNDKNERIGKIDDIIIGQGDRALFAVLQVGGFLGVGKRLVAVPYQSLVIDEAKKTITIPGASRDELKNLGEFKYRA
jgi:hypothetical protein